MDDEPEISAMVASACFFAFAIIFLVMFATHATGCVRHEVEAPQLDQALQAAKDYAACPEPVQVNPIPHQLRLVIDGETVDADAAGKRLLVDYSRCYSAGAPGTAN